MLKQIIRGIIIALIIALIWAGSVYLLNRQEEAEREFLKQNFSQEELKEMFLQGIILTEDEKLGVKMQMTTLAMEAEFLYVSEDNYKNLSCKNSQVKSICQAIKEYSGEEPIIISSLNKFCAYAKISQQTSYCIDSSGTRKEASSDLINTSGYCSGGTFKCPK